VAWVSFGRLSGVDDARSSGDGDGLELRVGAEFLDHPLHVGAGGVAGDVQPLADGCVPQEGDTVIDLG
jgi:hypothetical protein